MPKMTDYVREGFKRRQRPWNKAELPEWWGLATWFGFGALVVAIVLAAVLDSGKSGDPNAGAEARAANPVESINPYTPSPGPSPSGGSSAGPAPATPPPASAGTSPTGSQSGEPPTNDFTATSAVSIKKTGGGGDTIVPAGARNVALAGARAEAIGDWTGIPYTAPDKPPQRTKTPQGSVMGELTVADPAVTGSSFYIFSAMIKHEPAGQPRPVQITVQRAQSGYTAALRKGTGPAG